LAQERVHRPEILELKGLGPGFWPVTLLLTVLSLICAWYFWFGNIDWLMPGASTPLADRTADIDGLFRFMSVFGAAIQIFVTGYVVYFAIAFRARPGESREMIGVPVHDSPKLEFWWTVLPSAWLIILVIFSIIVWYKIYFGVSAPALTTEVVGHQFYFEFRYPGLKTPVVTRYGSDDPNNAMHIPVGVPVRVLITSADVIHQWWIPELRVKSAAVPGLVTNLNFTALHAGTYDITCTEFCGPDHSVMQGKVIVEPVAAFNKWLDAEKAAAAAGPATINLAGGDAAAGHALFAQKCSACHNNPPTPFDQKLVGPGLLHITDDPAHPNLVTGKPPTPANIADILQNGFTGPIGTMPNRQANGLSDKDIANLVAFLVSLK
jgi:cytochrome c oxidase subunit 2